MRDRAEEKVGLERVNSKVAPDEVEKTRNYKSAGGCFFRGDLQRDIV